jgi:hypothetical protein
VPPHGLQVPGAAPVHTSVESQARPGQQSSPEPPHAWQTPPTHARLAVLQAAPVVQHAWPLAPQVVEPSDPASPPELELESAPLLLPLLLPLPPLLLALPLLLPDSVVPSAPPSLAPTFVELLPPQEAEPTATPSGIAVHRNHTLQRMRMTSLPLSPLRAQQSTRHPRKSPNSHGIAKSSTAGTTH